MSFCRSVRLFQRFYSQIVKISLQTFTVSVFVLVALTCVKKSLNYFEDGFHTAKLVHEKNSNLPKQGSIVTNSVILYEKHYTIIQQ